MEGEMHSDATVFVVDDDPAILRLISELVASFGLKIQSWTSAEQFLAECRPNGPGCLILDVTMPGMSGLKLQQSLPAAGITLPVVMITAHGDVRMAVDAMRAGACQFLEKPLRMHELWESIQEAIARDQKKWLQRRQHEMNTQKLACLTPAERQVLDGIVTGKTNKMIAEEHGLSVRTIEERRGKLTKKLGVETRAELMELATSLAEPQPSEPISATNESCEAEVNGCAE
jgi:FixJ family two-component response regulator